MKTSYSLDRERLVMKKTDWPIRWDLLLRYRLIETIALWHEISKNACFMTIMFFDTLHREIDLGIRRNELQNHVIFYE